MAQEMFDLVSTETRDISPNWKRLQRDLASPDSKRRTAASKLLSQVADGTRRQTQQGAKNAACLILYTLAGLTLEEIGLAFDHDKGHIWRLVEAAADTYRRRSQGQGPRAKGQRAELTESELAALDSRPRLDRRERDRIRKKARRFLGAIYREPEPERGFFIELIRQGVR